LIGDGSGTAQPGEVHSFVWEWHFDLPPERLWPLVSDTDRASRGQRRGTAGTRRPGIFCSDSGVCAKRKNRREAPGGKTLASQTGGSCGTGGSGLYVDAPPSSASDQGSRALRYLDSREDNLKSRVLGAGCIS